MTILTLIALSAAHADAVDLTVEAARDATLDIDIACGTVEVVGTGKPLVHVTGQATGLELDGGAHRVGISAVDYDNDDCPRLHIEAPSGATVRFEGRSTDASIKNLTGRVDVEVISGDIRIAGTPEAVDVEAISGTVHLRGPMPRVDVETVSGDVTVEEPAGRLTLESVSGDISISGGKVAMLDVEAVSGDISLSTAFVASVAVDVSTHSGRLDVVLPKGVQGAFELSTHSGDLEGDLPTPVERPQYGPGASCSFALGTSDARFSLETFSGNIRVSGP